MAFRRSVLDKIVIREDRFGVEPEFTAKMTKQRCRIYEVPISEYGRDYSQGKTLGVRDALLAAWRIDLYRIADRRFSSGKLTRHLIPCQDTSCLNTFPANDLRQAVGAACTRA